MGPSTGAGWVSGVGTRVLPDGCFERVVREEGGRVEAAGVCFRLERVLSKGAGCVEEAMGRVFAWVGA